MIKKKQRSPEEIIRDLKLVRKEMQENDLGASAACKKLGFNLTFYTQYKRRLDQHEGVTSPTRPYKKKKITHHVFPIPETNQNLTTEQVAVTITCSVGTLKSIFGGAFANG